MGEGTYNVGCCRCGEVHTFPLFVDGEATSYAVCRARISLTATVDLPPGWEFDGELAVCPKCARR